MSYIKSLHIKGFKKFFSLDVQFNEHMNILVGENEAGKSTILDALKIVMNQQYRNADKSVLRDLFNTQMIAAFQAEPSAKTLPYIYIEVELALDPQQKMLLTFMEKCMGRKNSKLKNSVFALSASTMKSLVQVWNSSFLRERFLTNTMP